LIMHVRIRPLDQASIGIMQLSKIIWTHVCIMYSAIGFLGR